MASSKFFDQLKDHSEIKLRILSNFITPWSAKLGYKVRAWGKESLWYVDGFAGPGKYADGSEGSPVVGAQRALGLLQEARGYTLGCINIEIRRNRYSQLCKEMEPYQQKGVSIWNLNGDFSESVPDVQAIVGQDDPILLFVDPFGLSPIKFLKLQPLLSRRGETDLILTFQTRAISRLVKNHPNYLTEAVGSGRWLDEWDKRAERAVFDVFSHNLKASGRFYEVATYGIRGEKGSTPKYHLFFASRSYAAFELLNDSVCQEEGALTEVTYAKAAQMTFLPELDARESEAGLVNAVLEFGDEHRRTTRQEIVQHIVVSRWGQWHTREVNKAVKALIEAGRINRDKDGRGHIATDPLTFV